MRVTTAFNRMLRLAGASVKAARTLGPELEVLPVRVATAFSCCVF
jgi:hypothetical protein